MREWAAAEENKQVAAVSFGPACCPAVAGEPPACLKEKEPNKSRTGGRAVTVLAGPAACDHPGVYTCSASSREHSPVHLQNTELWRPPPPPPHTHPPKGYCSITVVSIPQLWKLHHLMSLIMSVLICVFIHTDKEVATFQKPDSKRFFLPLQQSLLKCSFSRKAFSRTCLILHHLSV